jgi:hypothetical protein
LSREVTDLPLTLGNLESGLGDAAGFNSVDFRIVFLPRIVVDTSNRDYVRKRRVLLKNYVISLPPGVSMRLSGSQGEQDWFDLWGGINLVQFRIVGENRMEQSRTFLDNGSGHHS